MCVYERERMGELTNDSCSLGMLMLMMSFCIRSSPFNGTISNADNLRESERREKETRVRKSN